MSESSGLFSNKVIQTGSGKGCKQGCLSFEEVSVTRRQKGTCMTSRPRLLGLDGRVYRA